MNMPGFAVVGLHESIGFTPVTNIILDMGFRFDEIWIFGEPQTPWENKLWKTVAPIVTWIPVDKIHRIARNKEQNQAMSHHLDESPEWYSELQRVLLDYDMPESVSTSIRSAMEDWDMQQAELRTSTRQAQAEDYWDAQMESIRARRI